MRILFLASDNVNYRQFKLNSSGKIVKNKTVKDGNDDEWKTAARLSSSETAM